MKFPKNIMQIGTVDEGVKIYIEDYVHTYIKQNEDKMEHGETSYVLFGKEEWDGPGHYLLIYGATTDLENYKSIHSTYFSEYQVIGKLEIYKGNRTILLDSRMVVHFEGFYIFYESNYAMQSYLIHLNRKTEVEEKNYRTINKEVKAPERIVVVPRKRRKFYPAITGLGIVIVVMVVYLGMLLRGDTGQMEDFVMSMKRAATFEESGETEEDIIFVEEIAGDKLYEEGAVAEIENKEEKSDEIAEMEVGGVEEVVEAEEVEKPQETVVVMEVEEIPENAEIYNEVDKTYIIQEGDTLVEVSRRRYQTEDMVPDICQLNEIQNPDKIIPGQVIQLP